MKTRKKIFRVESFLLSLILFSWSSYSSSCSATAPAAISSDTSIIQVPGGTVHVRFERGNYGLSRAELLEWVKDASRAIVAYFGRYPMKRTTVVISPESGRGVGFATATSDDNDDGLIEIPVGRYTTLQDLKEDWTLTHEMVHLNFPLVTDNRTWVAEGMATYVEPLGRMKAGNLTGREVWGELVRQLPQGLPRTGDAGLDHTTSWGRTYWGGALFFLVADVEIRLRTGNRKGVQDALKAIAASGGHIGSNWSVEQAFATGDRATGVPVLQELYGKMGRRPVSVDLNRLFKLLGVERQGRSVIFNDEAPLAHIRRAISGESGEGQTI